MEHTFFRPGVRFYLVFQVYFVNPLVLAVNEWDKIDLGLGGLVNVRFAFVEQPSFIRIIQQLLIEQIACFLHIDF